MTCLITSRPRECLPLKSCGTPIGLKQAKTLTDCTLSAAQKRKVRDGNGKQEHKNEKDRFQSLPRICCWINLYILIVWIQWCHCSKCLIGTLKQTLYPKQIVFVPRDTRVRPQFQSWKGCARVASFGARREKEQRSVDESFIVCEISGIRYVHVELEIPQKYE